MKYALLLAVLAFPLEAAASSAAKLIAEVEGVYKHHFPNRVHLPGKADEKYEAHDVVKIVHHEHDHIYVSALLTFDNGHHCSFHGIAGYDNGVFVYNDPNPHLTDKQSCTVTVSVKGDSLHLTDRATPAGPSTCQSLCTARGGSLADYSIAMSKKHPIGDMHHLKASKEYLHAVKDFKEAQR